MLKHVLTLILFICLSSTLISQKDTTNNDIKTSHAFGFASSGDGGVGLSYRFLPNKLGFQINLLPIYSKDFFFQSTGISFLYRFKETRSLDAYAYLGNHLININPFDEGLISIYNTGIGAGINVRFVEYMTFQFQGGYAVYNLLRSGPVDFIDKPFSFLSLGLGLHYNF